MGGVGNSRWKTPPRTHALRLRWGLTKHDCRPHFCVRELGSQLVAWSDTCGVDQLGLDAGGIEGVEQQAAVGHQHDVALRQCHDGLHQPVSPSCHFPSRFTRVLPPRVFIRVDACGRGTRAVRENAHVRAWWDVGKHTTPAATGHS